MGRFCELCKGKKCYSTWIQPKVCGVSATGYSLRYVVLCYGVQPEVYSDTLRGTA